MQIALQMLQQNGGVAGVLDKFRQGGYARPGQFVAKHRAEPADLGKRVAGGAGQRHDRPDRRAARAVARRGRGGLAQVLPQIVDKLTPLR